MDKREKVLVAYAGVRELQGGKKGYKYYDIEKDEYSMFRRKLIDVGVGIVFEVGLITGDLWSGGYDFPKKGHVKRYGNRELVTSWSVEHRDALLRFKQKSEAKKEHPASLESLVEQMRRSMSVLKQKDRARVALWVYNKLI